MFRVFATQHLIKIGGIGVEMDVIDGLIEVIAPIDDSPASRAGILAKDIITHVDEESVRDISLQEAIEILRGPSDQQSLLAFSGKSRANRKK